MSFPESVTLVSFYSFENCTGLTSVVLPHSLVQLGDAAFRGCTSLQYAIFKSSPYLGTNHFDGCTSLVKGAYQTGGGTNPFDPSIPSVCFHDGGCLIEDGNIWSSDKSKLYFVAPDATDEFVIPASVDYVGENAFKGCSQLTDISSDNLVAPAHEANNFEDFYYTVNLKLKSGSFNSYLNTCDWSMFKNIYVGGKLVTNLSDATFKYRINPDSSEAIVAGVTDPSITSATIPDKVNDGASDRDVTIIGKAAFKGITSMTTLTLPANLTAIHDEAFSGCSGLTSVTLPETVTSVGDCAFAFCSNLASFNGKFASADNKLLVVDGKLISFAISPLYDYPSYTIPASVTSIGKDAFNGISGLHSVTIPYTVAEIGDRAFNAPNLGTVRVERGDLPEIGSNVFVTGLAEFELQVPTGRVSSVSDIWKDSFTKVTEFSKDIVLTDAEGYTNNIEDWYTSASYTRKFPDTNWHGICLPFGMYISDWSDYGNMAELVSVYDNTLQLFTLSRGAYTEPGKPYFFQPISAGETTFSIDFNSMAQPILKSCEYLPVVDCSGYKLQGTYVTKTDMAAIQGYALHNGNFLTTDNDAKTLNPFRIFLTVPSSSGAPVRINVDGEDISGIDELVIDYDSTTAPAYNLLGIPVDDNYKGVVIINGQKIIRK